MKSLLITLAVAIAAFGGVLVYKANALPCKQVLHYAIGSFDERFGLTEEAFMAELVRSEKIWEDAEGRELFEYDPEATFQVNLIYDERQQRTVEGKKLDQARAELEARQNSIQASQETMVQNYERKVSAYKAAKNAYEKRLKKYNQDVEYWNKQGGAPRDEYERLQKESSELNKEREDLNDLVAAINSLANSINKTSKQHVALVDQYNNQVETYVGKFGQGGEAFEEGDYTGSAIDIYQFADLGDLRVVLAHEMGHALGLEHVENPKSIMYYLMGQQDQKNVTLSTEDTAALQTQCSMGPVELAKQDFLRLKQQLTALHDKRTQ